MPDSPCTCDAPGLCPLAKFTLTAREWELCRSSAQYRASFRSGVAPQHYRESLRNRTPLPTFDCIHRGLLLEIGTCNLCSLKGQPFDVLTCDLHGRCSIHKRHSKVRACIACPDRQAPEYRPERQPEDDLEPVPAGERSEAGGNPDV